MNYLQSRKRLTDFKNKFMVTKGEKWDAGINQEFEINIYLLLLHLKQIISKDSLYSTRNFTPYSVITYTGKESEKNRYMCMYN